MIGNKRAGIGNRPEQGAGILTVKELNHIRIHMSSFFSFDAKS